MGIEEGDIIRSSCENSGARMVVGCRAKNHVE